MLSGQISSSDPSCDDAGEVVQIQRRLHDETQYYDFESANTDADGRFVLAIDADENAEYVAVAAGHDQCAAATSDPVTVLVRARVSIRANDKTPRRGSTVRINGTVGPNHEGSEVHLQRLRRGGGWETVLGDRLERRSRFLFEFEATGPKTQLYRARWPSQDDDHEAGNEPGTSRELKLKLHN